MATGNVINPTTGGIPQSTAQNRVPKQELGKDEFLKILAVQLSNQDPLEPMQDTDFIAQTAQFSSLEQMQELNNSYVTSQAHAMIGKNVVATITDENGISQTIFGKVTGVLRSGKTDYLQVGSYYVPLGSVSETYDTGVDSNALIAQASNLVGKKIEAKVPEDVKDPSTGETTTKLVDVSGEVEAIIVKDNTLYVKLKGTGTEKGKEVPVAYITKIGESSDEVNPL